MEYEIITAKYSDGLEYECITIPLNENSVRTFPVDESNPDFIAFVEANPDWNKK